MPPAILCSNLHSLSAYRVGCGRHSNRKLYDVETSTYVSLDDVARLVRAGETVQIVDNVTGEDITAQTLTQIILKEGKRGRSVLPTELLHDVLRRGGKAIDVGIEQTRHGVDDLMLNPLGRLTRTLPRPLQGAQRDELRQLREQLTNLEETLSGILEDRTVTEKAEPRTNSETAKSKKRGKKRASKES